MKCVRRPAAALAAALAASLLVVAPAPAGAAGGPLGEAGRYPDVNTGSSFLMAVELTPAGPRTRAVLTYSLPAGAASPHHADQSELFSRGGWVTERFTETEIRAYPHLATASLRPSSPPA
ncbi:penicillin acylase family protein [Streptosporangium sandarakinum]